MSKQSAEMELSIVRDKEGDIMVVGQMGRLVMPLLWFSDDEGFEVFVDMCIKYRDTELGGIRELICKIEKIDELGQT